MSTARGSMPTRTAYPDLAQHYIWKWFLFVESCREGASTKRGGRPREEWSLARMPICMTLCNKHGRVTRSHYRTEKGPRFLAPLSLWPSASVRWFTSRFCGRWPLRNPSNRPETFSMMSGQDLIHFLEGGPIKGQKLELGESGGYFRHACTSSSIFSSPPPRIPRMLRVIPLIERGFADEISDYFYSRTFWIFFLYSLL